MKTRLNITIDESLLERIKGYAAKRKTSVSELVESYFKHLTKPSNRRTIIDLVDRLDKPSIPEGKDLKKAFYEDQAEKYGF
ncbi:MAG: DUF6364 family protein [Cyclobacteriaceae bacterium]